MYPVLPFGPFTIPTGPIILLIAATMGLELAGRFGRRFGLAIDDLWNSGLIAILAGLIVARLWNVIQFWAVYLAEPLLIISLRPSGFVLLPGLVAAVAFAYVYLLRRALAPVAVTVSLLVGAVSAWALIQAGGLLTGSLLGVKSDVPWAINYFGESRHPVALYYGLSLALLIVCIWFLTLKAKPVRVLLFLLAGVGLIYLTFGAFEHDTLLVGSIRAKQFGGWLIALLAVIGLARVKR